MKKNPQSSLKKIKPLVMNKLVLFFSLCFFVPNYCFSQASISNEISSNEIKEKFDEVFMKTLPSNSILNNKGIENLTAKGLDAELEIIDFLSSQFSVERMEQLLDSIRTNKKIEKIANRLFKQIEYATNEIKKELKKGSQRKK